ncbi:GDSL-type esterase/lipase family protein [Chitinophaga lutea]
MKRLLLFLLLLCIGKTAMPQNCSTPIRIVVLGTSTAWGGGLPSRDSAWTFHFARYLKANHNTQDTIINLSSGGFTTQHFMPTGTPSYTVNGTTYNVNTNYNITRAVSLAPQAIILSVSYEDESFGFPMTKTVANYLAIKQVADAANIPLWVTTTHPREWLGTAGTQRLAQMKDSIIKYFGEKAIDFYTGMTNAQGTFAAAYSANDGFHFNAAGQRVLFDRVVAKNIPAALCTPQPVTPFVLASFAAEKVEDKLKLNWRTTSETSTLRFLLERSADSLNWSSIADIPAAGRSTLPRDYTFTDPAIHSQAMYYRLNMEDSAHTHYFSSVVKATPDVWYHMPFRLSSISVSAVGGQLKIDWSTLTESNTIRFRVQRSADSATWTEIGTVAAAGSSLTPRSYSYTDVNVSSGQTWYYRLNMEATLNRFSQSAGVKGTVPNTPAGCLTPIRIVVLGSSTSWGAGLPSRDSAWTFRFARYLKTSHNTQDTIINLSSGGFTTQHFMPTGTPSYTVNGTTYNANTNYNITRAIALAPQAIIISVPYEDESFGFPMTKTIANYLAIKQAADAANIPLWVSTTHPREWLGTAGTQRLAQMKDSIIKYFGEKAIDFYTGLTNAQGTFAPEYSSGDGFNFNAAGQRVLFDRVVAKNIPAALCTPQPVTPFVLASFAAEKVEDKLKLNWRTTSETSTLRFLLERSADSLSWSSIADIPAAGRSASPRDYTFTDPAIHSQAMYYRLNMEDSAHTHYFSSVVKATPDVWYHTPFRLSSISVTAVGGQLRIDWSTLTESNTVRFRVQRSADSATWTEIGTVAAAGSSLTPRSYSYTDVNVSSGQTWYYRLNMEATLNRFSQSAGVKGTVPNTLPNCNTALRIVVLGSSSAWGNGPAVRDSAWVFRFSRFLKASHNAQDTVINLAIGGYTTHHILPTGTPNYTVNGITFAVDPNQNITRAIALNPDAIIINMPSNDEARGFPATVQRDNFLLLKQLAAQANIPLWVTTTQPRSNLGYAGAANLRSMRDTIFKYFGARAVDFYNGLATSQGLIEPVYDAGDGVHLTSDGHVILFNRMASENLPDTICAIRNGTALATVARAMPPGILPEPAPGNLYPNPATHYVILPRPAGESFSLEIFNAHGQAVLRERRATQTRLDVSAWRPGVYIVVIDGKHRYKLVKL